MVSGSTWACQPDPSSQVPGDFLIPCRTRPPTRRCPPSAIRDRRRWASLRRSLEVEIRLRSAFHDEFEARLDVLAHELGEYAVSLLDVVDGDAEQPPGRRIQRRAAQLLGLHLAEALDAHDLR